MKKYIPNMYKKNVMDIDYSKLKKLGITCLIFDLDNTIALIDEEDIPDKIKKLFTDLKKDFQIIIVSNNVKKRIKRFCEPFKVSYISFAMKPFTFCFNKVLKKNNLTKGQMCIIGDQLMTDVLGGNRFGIYTILVDPLGKKDLKVTTINRYLENRKIKKLSKLNILERGKYYE